MKKTAITLLTLAALVTSCRDRVETPEPTSLTKSPTQQLDTIDVRDIASGYFVDSLAQYAPTIQFITDSTTIDKMVVIEQGRVIDTISIEGEEWGFVFFGTNSTDYPAKIDGYYMLDSDMWVLRVITDSTGFNEGEITIYNFNRVN